MTIETSPPAPRAPAPVHQHPSRPAARTAGNADAAKGGGASFASLLGGLGAADTESALADSAALPGDGNQAANEGAKDTSQQRAHGHGHGRRGGVQDLTGIGNAASADADPAAAALAAAMAAGGDIPLRAAASGTTAAEDGVADPVGATAALPAKAAASTTGLAASAAATAAAAATGKGAAAPATAAVVSPGTAGLTVAAAPASPPSARSLTDVAGAASRNGAALTAAVSDGAKAADRAERGRVLDPALAGIDMKLAAGDGAAADGSESLGSIFAQMRHVLAHAAASARGVATGAGISAASVMGSGSAGAMGGAATAGAPSSGTASLTTNALAFTSASAAAASSAQLQGRATAAGDAAAASAGIAPIGGAGAQLAALATGAGEANTQGGGAGRDRRETAAAGGIASAAPGFGTPAATAGSSGWNDALQAAGGTAGADAASADFLLQRSPEDALADRIGAWVNQKTHSAELTMDAGGSPVQVRIALSGAEAHVQFRTDQAETRQMLGSAVGDLRDMLQKEGLLLTGVEVGTTSGGQAQAGDARQSGAQARGGRAGAIAAGRAAASGAAQAAGVAAGRPRIGSTGKDGAVDVFA